MKNEPSIASAIRDNFVWFLEKVTPMLSALSLLLIRIILAWEFYEAGYEKLHGTNWFIDIADKFPWPFRILPVNLNWTIATYSELIGALFILLGLATRFSAITLMMLTIVAIASVHWPQSWSSVNELWQGYTLIDEGHGNFKLPFFYLVMLFTLVARGGGFLSLDAWLTPRSILNR